ncbi:DUF7344 domain-containing protein [Halorarius litoreus]|uniref:DUF7344 domain-containing protein n=1 Tax=Halorarius litoreus TaxID=2962676 RepID=UPI003D9CBC2C
MAPTANSPVSPNECDDIFQTLSHEVRRETIRAFETNSLLQTTTVESLATELESRIAHPNRRQIRLELVHNHLPKLESRKWLEYDQRAGDVVYKGHPRALPVLEHISAIF